MSRDGQPGLAKRGNDRRAEEAENKHHHRRNSGLDGRRGRGGLLHDRQGGLARNFVDVFIRYAGDGRRATNAMLPLPCRDFANYITSRPSCLIRESCFSLPRPCVLVAVMTLPRGANMYQHGIHMHTRDDVRRSRFPSRPLAHLRPRPPFVVARGRHCTTWLSKWTAGVDTFKSASPVMCTPPGPTLVTLEGFTPSRWHLHGMGKECVIHASFACYLGTSGRDYGTQRSEDL